MEEEIIIPLIIFSFIALVIKMSLDYAKWRRTHDRPSEQGLRTSELKALIREAVEEANAPLVARLEALEMLEAGEEELLLSRRPAELPQETTAAERKEP
jgi:hypothetical protein